MEHYFLFILNGHSSKEEEFLSKYIDCLAPLNKFTNTEQDNSLLFNNSIFYYVIDFQSHLKKDVDWETFYSSLGFKQVSDCTKKEETLKVNTKRCDSSLIADHVNYLADQLPISGSFKLDVVITESVLVNFSVNANLEFAASLHRLTKWHSAHTIFLDINKDQLDLNDWFQLTNAEILSSDSQPKIERLFWRGSIEFSHPNISTLRMTGFELQMQFKDKQMYNNSDIFPSLNSKSKYLLLHPVLRAMDVCNFASVPQHLILPMFFNLYTTNSSQKNSLELGKYICNNSKAALILRLGYSILTEKPKPDKSLNTNKWLKMVLSGNVKYPENSLPNADSYLTLVVTQLPDSKAMVAYVLRNPMNLNPQFYFNAVNMWNFHSYTPANNEIKDQHLNFDFGMPFLSDSSIRDLLQCVLRSDSEFSCNSDFSSKDFNSLLTSFVDLVNGSEHQTLHLSESLVNVSYEDIDPTDWPERVYLLRKQIQIEEKKNLCNFTLNLSPKRAYYNVSLSGDDIKRYFLPSGEAKDVEKIEPVQSLNNKVNHNSETFEQLLKAKWPDILNYSYADIYYNVNSQSEEKENVGNKMVRCFVQHETASTCNLHQNVPEAPISVLANHVTPRKRHKSSKLDTSLRQAMLNPNAKVKEQIFKNAEIQDNPVISTIIKTLGVKKSPQTAGPSKSFSSRIRRKSYQPVRCSPRKKNAVKYFSSASRKAIEIPSKKTSNELQELLKKKLRVAVATALENNAINMNDPLFRPCFKKLFTICQTYVQDIPRSGSTSQHMQKIADTHVKQVIQLEKETRK